MKTEQEEFTQAAVALESTGSPAFFAQNATQSNHLFRNGFNETVTGVTGNGGQERTALIVRPAFERRLPMFHSKERRYQMSSPNQVSSNATNFLYGVGF